jgi:hypothetical protein
MAEGLSCFNVEEFCEGRAGGWISFVETVDSSV